MPIVATAIVEMVLAIALLIGSPLLPQVDGFRGPGLPVLASLCGIVLLNAAATIWRGRLQPEATSTVGLALAALGGALVLPVAGAGLWVPWFLPRDGGLIETVAVLFWISWVVDLLAGAAMAIAASGWALVLLGRWRERRLPA